MPTFGPIKRRDLVRYLIQSGFDGPYSGGRHQFMVKGQLKVFVPNPHDGDIGRNLLAKILKEADIDRAEWEKL
jgi:predicted RNA binding protein YcfA (HicA-like mRNA interferase family)